MQRPERLADPRAPGEGDLRAPALWIADVRTPTWIMEGSESPNSSALDTFAQHKDDAPVHVLRVRGAGHFDLLAPGTELLAEQIRADLGPAPRFILTPRDLAQAVEGGAR